MESNFQQEWQQQVTARQAFAAMHIFVSYYFDTFGNDAIGNLLGDVSLTGDGLPADPASAGMWLDALTTAKHMTEETLRERTGLHFIKE